jgi:carbon monoxide dehydrogenase subunit G
MIRFETTVEIARPRDDVFDYVADPARFAEWNSAVESVVPLAPGRYLMRRVLPSGPAANGLAIEAHPPAGLTLRTIDGPTPFVYRYTFEPASAGTRITLQAEVELGGVAALLGPLAAHAVKRGVEANFATLREILGVASA